MFDRQAQRAFQILTLQHVDRSIIDGYLGFLRDTGVATPAQKNRYSATKAVLDETGLGPADIDWVVAHQANLRILSQVSSRIDVPLERFVLNIEKYGNTSSASIPIALDEAVRDGRIKPGHTLAMCALGAGISWGGAVVRF